MLLTIHDANLQKVAFIDNEKQGTLNYYDDTWTRSLATGSSTFEFTVFKKAVKSDLPLAKAYHHLNEHAFVSFKYKGKSFVFNIIIVEENEQTIKCYCENLNLELINELANPYKSNKAMTFKEYCEAMDLLNYTHLSIGINEISDYKRTLEWEGQETKLARLLSLAKRFDAEIEFDTQLNADSTIKKFSVNVYHENDDNHQGVGRVRNDVIVKYGKNIHSITRKVDKTGIFNTIRPTGKMPTVEEEPSGDKGSKSETVKNADGSTTKTTISTASDGTKSKTIVHTKVTKLADKTRITTTTTTRSDGSIEQTVTTSKKGGASTSETKVLKKPNPKEKTNTTEDVLTIEGLDEWEVKNEKGIVEFYQRGQALYAPISMQLYPSTFTHSTGELDQWTRKDFHFETDEPNELRRLGYLKLKKYCYPAITYEVDGFVDADIGDTVKVHDDGFAPLLMIQARVTDQKISFTNPVRNKTIFDNFKALENKLSADIQSAFERLFEAAKPYTIKLSTDNGVIFKNQIGQSLVTPTLYKGGKPVVVGVTWRWALDGEVTTGMTYLVRGSNVTDTVTLTVAAYIGNKEVAVDEISLVNVADGKLGTPGTPGRDGRTPYVHTAWANNATGTDGFSLDSSINKLYIGIYTDFEPNDSTDPKKYKWAKVKGDKGDKGEKGERGLQGLDGLQGARGERGLPGRNGADGRTQYTHIAYSNSADGTKDFSVSASDRAYIGMYVDFNSADSNTPSDYNWTLVKGSDGANGVAGKAGADGRTPYLHIAYATSNNGSQGFSTTDSTNKTYIGTYTDYTQSDSTDYRVYKWTLIKGADGTGISNVTNYYLATTVSTGITRASAGWTTTPQPITSDKRYLWNYRVELYTNGTSKTTAPTVIGVHGEKGERGLQGEQGIPGIRGTDGRTQYTHIAYADNAVGGGFSQTNTNKPYIGMYVDFNAADSTNPTVYKWTKWKGEDGAQGVPGVKGADGRTPYFHRAWSNSADGRDGFSTTDSTNKRYLGTLTDFTEADSQDPARYKWTALFENVFGGNRNYFKNGRTQQINTGNRKMYDMRTFIVDDFWKNPDRLKPNYVHISFEISLSPALAKDTQAAVHFSATPWYSKKITLKAGVTTSQKFDFIINLSGASENYKTDNIFVRFGTNYGFPVNLTVTLKNAMLAIGTNFHDYVKAIEDVETDIASKADQSLTQEQLNALNEKSQILEAEMKAKASMEAFSELEKAYNAFVKLNADSQKKSESDLVEAGRRIDLLTTQFGGLAELKTFIDTYMKSTNEGLIIGKNDASSTIKVSSDRISMFSAGKEVMYISQGVINIDNGIFTASVQIGRFRTEQYYLKKDVNVIRYVGG
ncbi:putative antireceptor [Streptococcus pneumoniae]|uniref:Putative antireceptor n=1 Tax=Streptococcus pneumoniae TaxID=1313 RepID=A0A4M3JYL5_STREE|nr:phage tail protein [Streptococcus pneumoniae]CGF47558.1 putative antireceptor [Streptococcus pneumoniae]CGF78523.1 putative antireceptor [Streptococcus pneumoniae]CGG55067.1 putative antireceptor [Streptococcus pneumoniae]CIN61125.1 putative antireceptor [Streptococcus pneumoniae]CIP13879.1 putative antireceptor [Streptococcus pneumoniae]